MHSAWRQEDERVRKTRIKGIVLSWTPFALSGVVLMLSNLGSETFGQLATFLVILSSASMTLFSERIHRIVRKRSTAHLGDGVPAALSVLYDAGNQMPLQIGSDVGRVKRDGAFVEFAGARCDMRIANGDVSSRFIAPESFEARPKLDPSYAVIVTLDMPENEFDLFIDDWLAESKETGSIFAPRSVQRDIYPSWILFGLILVFLLAFATLIVSFLVTNRPVWIGALFMTLSALMSVGGAVFIARYLLTERRRLDEAALKIKNSDAATG